MTAEPLPDDPAPRTAEDEPGADPAFDDAEDELAARRWRAFQRDRTARLEVYTQAAQVLLAARGFPVLGGGDATLSASNQENLDAALKRVLRGMRV